MFKRLVIPAVATLCALLLLWVVLQVRTEPTQPARTAVRPPSDLDMTLNPSGGDALGRHSQVVQDSQATSFSHVNERGTLIQFSYQSLKLLPEGVSDVQDPRARIHLRQDRRVLQIESKRGKLIAPDRHPRSGTLEGEVVVSLFDAPGDETLNLQPDSPHLRLRMDLEQARFDLELGQIDSEGPVRVSGERIEFEGQGLLLSYNELRKRVDRLEIDRGKYMLLKPESAASKAAGDAPVAAKPSREPAQFYRAVLQRQVRIQTPQATIEADTLTTRFSFGRRERMLQQLSAQPPTRHPAAASLSPMPLAWRLLTWLPALAPQGTERFNPAPTTAGEGQVLITWSGKLTMEPLDQRPADLADDDDAALELVGRPVVASTQRGETLQGARLQYVASIDSVTVYGSDGYPLSLDSSRLGVMHGTRLVADLHHDTATVFGPGHLRARGEPGLFEIIDRQRQLTGLPRGTAIFWQDRLDLAFLRAPRQAGDKTPQVQALRAAEFLGDVQVSHPSFDLRGDKLALGLGDEANHQNLRQIIIVGGVRASAKSPDPNEQLEIESERLVLQLQPDAQGRPQPAKLTCTEQVRGSWQGQRLRAAMMEVAFAGVEPVVRVPELLPPELADRPVSSSADPLAMLLDPFAAGQPLVPQLAPPSPAERSPDDVDHRMARASIRRLVAEKDVEIEISQPAARIVGHRLVADLEADQVEVFGLADQRARVVRDDGELIGDHLVLHTLAQTVHVVGPGVFSVNLRPSARDDQPDAPAKPAGPLDTAGELTVQWTQAMHFDNRSGLAQFLGSVTAEALQEDNQSLLSAQDVRLDLTDSQLALPPEPVDGTPDARPAAAVAIKSRVLRMLVARGDVVFESQQVAQPGDTVPQHRLRLEGPLLSFDNVLERLQVVGPGRMLFEDYRERRPAKAQAAAASSDPLVQFAGRGVSLFTWQGQLTLDALHNDMLLDQGVQMLHAPQDNRQPVQLDCRRFVADLESGDGLNSWFTGATKQPRLTAAIADGSVRLRSGTRWVTTDHLLYTGADQVALLRAAEGKMTTVHDPERPVAPTAKLVRWDLRQGRIEVEQPGSIVVPLSR